MNFPLSTFAVLGLGAPELIVVAIILAIMAALVVAVVWIIIALARGGSRPAAGVASHAEKKCPDCAEFVRSEARVCKHCGYRFDVASKNA